MAVPKHSDLLTGDNSYRISLVKLTGQAIADVHGYLTDEHDGAAFKLTHIVLANGAKIDVEGEHDFPYLADCTDTSCNLDQETLDEIHAQGEEG